MTKRLPDDWEAQVSRAYTVFQTDPLNHAGEFGFPHLDIDFLRRKAKDQLRDAVGRWRDERGTLEPEARGDIDAWEPPPTKTFEQDYNDTIQKAIEPFGFTSETVHDKDYIRTNITDSDGEWVGEMIRRMVDPTTIEHINFAVEKIHQKKKLGGTIFDLMEDVYRKHGIDTITTHAGYNVGPYAWAKKGFDYNWEKYGEKAIRQDWLQNRGQYLAYDYPGFEQQFKDYMEAMKNPDFSKRPTPLQLAMMGYTPGATKWFGKEILTGMQAIEWYGVKHLKPKEPTE